jgi:hypothetical protein
VADGGVPCRCLRVDGKRPILQRSGHAFKAAKRSLSVKHAQRSSRAASGMTPTEDLHV